MFDDRIALGLPSLAGYRLFEALEKAEALGFRSIMGLPSGPNAQHSLGPFPTFDLPSHDPLHAQRLRTALRPFGRVSIHQAWNTEWRQWIECAASLGAGVLTVHAGLASRLAAAEPEGPGPLEWLRRIADHAQGRNVRLGVENEGGAVQAFLDLIHAADHPNLGATLDVGHCAGFDGVRALDQPGERAERLNTTIGAIVRDLGQKLFLLHVHNVRAGDWRDHRSVPHGVIDFPRLFDSLRSTGYSGGFDIELEEAERERTAAETGQYLSSLCTALPPRQV